MTFNDLEPLDPAYVTEVLSRPPFVTIDGVINVRDLGLYPSDTNPGQMTRPRLLYRSAELSGISKEGEKQLKALNISKVFDLRSDTEIRKYNTPQPEINDVEVAHIPVFQKEDYSPEMMAKYVRVTINTRMFAYSGDVPPDDISCTLVARLK
ncbi:hypothetical protein C0992_007145 [Termitomyces sp. T32_za158]|nr:hypothetical protein C0992_007145 [Termitomyces sp. T32_za158]